MTCRLLMLLLALLTASAVHAQDHARMTSEPRVALVIGNSAYKVGPLKNPVNDADDIAVALRRLGFRVMLRKDATQQQMVDAITEFGKELRKGGVGLFYFAGHGVQSKGANFLIPVSANVSSEAQLEFDTINAARVLSEMDGAGNRVNIMVLDACRDNPFARSFRTTSRGLVAMEAAKGTYISFATGPGSVAEDGTGRRNGIYTEQLLRSLQQPESEVDRVFRRVAADVSRVTGGRQSPWGSHNLTGDFYFRLDGGASVALATPTAPSILQADPRADDRALWETVKDSNNAAELQAYLDQFPDGIFAGVARARLKTLASARPNTQVTTVTSPLHTSEHFSVDAHDMRIAELPDGLRMELKLERGVIVENVQGEAMRAGIRNGDVILDVNNAGVKTVKQFVDIMSKFERGRIVAFLIQRGANYTVYHPFRVGGTR